MSKTAKIKVPFFVDDPIAGRCLSLLPLGFHDTVVVEEGFLRYVPRTMSPNPKKTFELKKIKNILLLERTYTGWTKEGRADPVNPSGSVFTVFIVDKDGGKHELIPLFRMDYRRRKMSQFLSELSESIGREVEIVTEPGKPIK